MALYGEIFRPAFVGSANTPTSLPFKFFKTTLNLLSTISKFPMLLELRYFALIPLFIEGISLGPLSLSIIAPGPYVSIN